tara:strand:+ start:1923 stop:2945 length:1023 start_codon:yes stop_codon:yes gene_type:complete
MSIYLGTHGKVELRREFDGNNLVGTVNASDVNATRKRLSFDFKLGQLITGDQVEITSTNEAALSFFSGYDKTSIKRFINVDALGGIRFYTTFANAINGGKANAEALAELSTLAATALVAGTVYQIVTVSNSDFTSVGAATNTVGTVFTATGAATGTGTVVAAIPIRVVVQNADFRVIAQVNSFELNTQREVIDTTNLSDSFRSQVSSLMSGSGNMSCFWEYTGETVQDLPMYLLQLILRTRVGSQFRAKFYLKSGNHNPSGIPANANDEIFYEFDGVLTACASQFSPSSTVQFTADFVTTGEIALKVSLESVDKILQEDSDNILLDQDSTAKLLLESSDT